MEGYRVFGGMLTIIYEAVLWRVDLHGLVELISWISVLSMGVRLQPIVCCELACRPEEVQRILHPGAPITHDLASCKTDIIKGTG